MIRSRFLSLLVIFAFSVFMTLSVCSCSPSTSSQPSSPASSPGQTATPTPTAVADLYYFTEHAYILPDHWDIGPHIPYIVYKGVPVTISERRMRNDKEEVRIVRQDGGPEGWAAFDELSSTPPPDSRIDVGIPIEIDGLSWLSYGPGHGSAMPPHLIVYRLAGVSPQTGFANAVVAMEGIGWHNESSEAIVSADNLSTHFVISGPPSLALANGLGNGKPMRRSVDLMWDVSDPSYLVIWYYQFDLVE